MNNQEMFNIVWEHAKKKQKSFKNDTNCAYRGRDNAMCFVGACIPDSMYHPEMDEVGASTSYKDIIQDFPAMNQLFNDVSTIFGMDLQGIHDFSDPEEWQPKLIILAKKWHLNIPE